MKVELQAKDQVVAFYECMEAVRARFAVKEREYEDQIYKMGMELEAKSTSE